MPDVGRLKQKLVRKMRELQDAGDRITYKELSRRTGKRPDGRPRVSVGTISNIMRGVQKDYRGSTLEGLAGAFGETLEFWSRSEDIPAPTPTPTPGRCAFTSVDDAKRILSRFYESIGPDHCRTFTIICDCRNGKGARVLAVVDGEVVYVGPDRHKG